MTQIDPRVWCGAVGFALFEESGNLGSHYSTTLLRCGISLVMSVLLEVGTMRCFFLGERFLHHNVLEVVMNTSQLPHTLPRETTLILFRLLVSSRTPIFEWYVLWCGSKRRHVFRRD